MRIYILEYFSGGALVDKDLPRSVTREGLLIRNAVLKDLLQLPNVSVIISQDYRLEAIYSNVETIQVTPGTFTLIFEQLVKESDAIMLIAPETNNILGDLSLQVENSNKPLMGSKSTSISQVTNKLQLTQSLMQIGLAVPPTWPLAFTQNKFIAPQGLSFPAVIKPVMGTACQGVYYIESAAVPNLNIEPCSMMIQQYIFGIPASVSLLISGNACIPLSLNQQKISFHPEFKYSGGTIPFNHPLKAEAIAAAVTACSLFSGLRGYVGVDLILTEDEPVIIEINPRITTSYIGLSQVANTNMAGLILSACLEERLPSSFFCTKTIDFELEVML